MLPLPRARKPIKKKKISYATTALTVTSNKRCGVNRRNPVSRTQQKELCSLGLRFACSFKAFVSRVVEKENSQNTSVSISVQFRSRLAAFCRSCRHFFPIFRFGIFALSPRTSFPDDSRIRKNDKKNK